MITAQISATSVVSNFVDRPAVTACKPCNQRKGGRTPSQAGMKLVRPAKRPQWLPSATVQMGVATAPERWKIYLKLERHHPERGPTSAHELDDDDDLG